MMLEGQYFHARGDARNKRIAEIYALLDDMTIERFHEGDAEVVSLNAELTSLGVPETA